MINADTAAFACPRCDAALDAAASGFRCGGCKVDFPLIGGLPWLFAEPNAALAEWRGRFDYLLRALEANEQRYRDAAKRPNLIDATRERLTTLAAATADHQARLRGLLEPLALARPAAALETFLALRTRLPPDQGLMTYYPNIHRDWCWGQEENAAALAVVNEALAGRAPGQMLVLGAGAGRLAYDLHEQTGAAATTALDFNPLLVMLGSRIAAGETLELHEFPLAPLDEHQAAPLRQLAAPAPARAGLEFVTADVHRPPFPAKRFATIVTPWLVDILPGDFGELCRQINRLLDDGGVWINFGSLNFHQSDPARQLGPKECFAIIEAEGFAPPWHRDTVIPYMCSPASRLARRETVLSWRAPKARHAKKFERHRALPDWLVRGREPVPATEHFKVAAASTRIHAHIMSMIDGRRSIADMAQLLEQQRLMGAADAEAAIRGLLIKLYDESQIRRP